jgi:hypothetical protein
MPNIPTSDIPTDCVKLIPGTDCVAFMPGILPGIPTCDCVAFMPGNGGGLVGISARSLAPGPNFKLRLKKSLERNVQRVRAARTRERNAERGFF